MMRICPWIPGFAAVLLVAGCATVEAPPTPAPEPPDYYGTLEPFASDAVYFVLTDRFVDGDVSNNFPEQGGAERGTFDRPIQLAGELPANIGYLGGDFRGVLDNAEYIADMGFTSVWITPIVDNPDEAFTGGIRPGEGFGADRGKTGYHGYWGVNFFVVDEHLESPGLTFADFTREMRAAGLKTVLDVVTNHGSPSYTMAKDQPKYGELYDADGNLVADHMNLHPRDLDPDNPLHAFFNRKPDVAQLADMNEDNPAVLEYFVAAYLQWIEQGADAFRIDTIKHMPHHFWASFAERIRAEHPDYFMFSEAYSFDASFIGEFTQPENGGISVLDFPGKEAMDAVFAGGAAYSSITSYLYLDGGPYANPYELMTFYDNHDMPRMDADYRGFIDAHNWLFTSRGIPIVYYGSESAFRAGAGEHGGNRDYFGQDNIELAKSHPVHAALTRIANLRKDSIALQRGLQVNLAFDDDTAVFARVYRKGDVTETALVFLNKGDQSATLPATEWLGATEWKDAFTRQPIRGRLGEKIVDVTVNAHDVRVLTSRDPAAVDVFAEALAGRTRD